MAARTLISRSSSTGSISLGSQSSLNGGFLCGSNGLTTTGPHPKSPSRWAHFLSTLKRIFVRASYVIFFMAVALYASVAVENMAQELAGSQQTKLPKSAKEIIHLIGSGYTNPLEYQQQLLAVRQQQPGVKLKPRQQDWRKIPIKEKLPVVIFAAHVPNEPNHPALRILKQARLTNELVYLVGPRQHRHLRRLRIEIEPKELYNETLTWVAKHLGKVQIDVYRWWVLRAFMERHKFQRVLVMSVDVMLYVNATEWASWLLPDAKVALPARWPSLQPPPLPSQYTSSSVSPHVGLWSLEALSDFLDFWKVVLEVALFEGGQPGDPGPDLMKRKEYRDGNILGWYTFAECWVTPNLDPPCMAEPSVGMTPKRAAKIRNKFTPKFAVESLCQPRWCQNTTWSDLGLCVFDNNFSVGTPSHFFNFPQKGKCPSSKLYEHYDAWMGGAPKRSVQFLAVHFQGSRRDYLKLEDPDPAKSWGSSPF